MLPDVCTSDHALLLALHQHQILTQHLSTTRRDMLKNWVKGGITRFVISTDQTQSQQESLLMCCCYMASEHQASSQGHLHLEN